jgi:hypothetical protein
VEARPVVTGGGGGGEAHDGGRLVGCGGGRALASARGEGAAAPPVNSVALKPGCARRNLVTSVWNLTVQEGATD